MFASVRGMNDVLPDSMRYWLALDEVVRDVMARYGYDPIRFPLLGPEALFTTGLGHGTDIVGKEMFTFEDRNGQKLSLRPEGTAAAVRLGLSQGALHNQIQRWWYQGPMYRHERPQRARYREFYQVGAEAFGMGGPDIDVEMIVLSYRLLEAAGVSDGLRLRLNTLGDAATRQAYRDALRAYFEPLKDALDPVSQRQLQDNPLRVLDSNRPELQALCQQAPQWQGYWDPDSARHFEQLCATLDQLGIRYQVDPTLVRGLDYYNRTVFEWWTDALGTQGAVCAGGRYDGLVALLGGKPTPAIGFAMGMDRVVDLMARRVIERPKTDVYVLTDTLDLRMQLWPHVEQWRRHCPHAHVVMYSGPGHLEAQRKQAKRLKPAMILQCEHSVTQPVTYTLHHPPSRGTMALCDVPALLGQYFNT